ALVVDADPEGNDDDVLERPGRGRIAHSAAACSGGRTYLSRRGTNSSAALGGEPVVWSDRRLVGAPFDATAQTRMIFGASAPSMWQPITRSLLASTTSLTKVRSSRPDSVFFIGLNRA